MEKLLKAKVLTKINQAKFLNYQLIHVLAVRRKESTENSNLVLLAARFN